MKVKNTAKIQHGFTRLPKRPIALTIFAIFIFLLLFIFSLSRTAQQSDELLINDVSRLNPTWIFKVERANEIKALQTVLEQAREQNLKVSIAGKRHSMGGHTFYKDAVVLDMTSFNKILSIDPIKKTIIVQSGATWNDVIEALNPYNLSIPVLQDYSGFTVGGSVSVNIHQSDPNYGPIIETVRSFRLLLADGSIRTVSRTENPELFSLVIGGYGLFGVILDVEMDLTKNDTYKKAEKTVPYKDYNAYFDTLQKNKEIQNIFARFSVVDDESLLDELIVTTYQTTRSDVKKLRDLQKDNTTLKKFVFGISRKYNYGKKIRWYLQKNHSNLIEPPLVTRNNLDYNDTAFLDYYSTSDTDILQEYFFPRAALPKFVDKLRDIVQKNDINLLSATVRYVPHNNESVLSYSDHEGDLFAVVLYMNVGTSDKDQEYVKKWTQELIEYSLTLDGTYYLPYQLYASQEQIRNAYPRLEEFFDKKLEYDPQELFTNTFYAKYAKQEEER